MKITAMKLWENVLSIVVKQNQSGTSQNAMEFKTATIIKTSRNVKNVPPNSDIDVHATK